MIENSIEIKGQLGGRFRMVVRKAATEELVHDSGWFDNLVLDGGLNHFGSLNSFSECRVGSSSVAPNVAQTSLAAQVATTQIYSASAETQQYVTIPVAPLYRQAIGRTYRFNVGVATGNLSEVGVGWDTGLWTRALIVDGTGTPTTITVLADEILDVTYELGVYPFIGDVNFQITIDGILRNCVLRSANLEGWMSTDIFGNVMTNFGYYRVYCTLNTGFIAAATSSPTGGIVSREIYNGGLPYDNNSLRRDVKFDFDINSGNITINSITLGTALNNFQISFVPPIVKTPDKTLSLTARWSWARYVP